MESGEFGFAPYVDGPGAARSRADEALCKNLNQLGMGVASLRNPAPHGDAV